MVLRGRELVGRWELRVRAVHCRFEHEDQIRLSLRLLRTTGPLSVRRVEVGQVEVAQDDQEIIARVAALDVGKAEVVCCVRVPGVGPRARRMQEVRTFTTMTRSLLAMADWLTGLGVTRVVMEATSDYWSECAVRNSPKGCGGKRGVC